VAAEVRTRPQYVMGNSPDLYYLAPDLDVDTPTELHAADTRLAMETLFNRSPSHLDREDLLEHLFTAKAIDKIRAGIIEPQAQGFQENQFHQKMELEDTIVNIQEGQGEATTVATAQLIRTGVANGATVNETWSVKVFFTWKSNPNLKDHAMYPTVCDTVTFFSMERISP
jgi:hypothetical protein